MNAPFTKRNEHILYKRNYHKKYDINDLENIIERYDSIIMDIPQKVMSNNSKFNTKLNETIDALF